MTKYHINKKGLPSICRAKKGNCPFGGEDSHFPSKTAAQNHISELYKKQYGIISDNPKRLDSTQKRINKAIKFLDLEMVSNGLYGEIPLKEMSPIVDEFIEERGLESETKGMSRQSKFEYAKESHEEAFLEKVVSSLPENKLHEYIDNIEKTLNLEEYYMEFDPKEFEDNPVPTLSSRVNLLRKVLGTEEFLGRMVDDMDENYLEDFVGSLKNEYDLYDYVDLEDSPKEQFETITRFLGNETVVKEMSNYLSDVDYEERITLIEMRKNLDTDTFVKKITNTMDSEYIEEFNDHLHKLYDVRSYVEEDSPEDTLEACKRLLSPQVVAIELSKWLPKPALESKLHIIDNSHY